jgi:hypothetical protein
MWVSGRSARHGEAGEKARHRQDAQRCGRDARAVVRERFRGERAQQDGDTGARRHQRVAADQFCRAQHLRQQGVLGRRKQGGAHPHEKETRQEQRQAVHDKADAGERHDGDLRSLARLQHARSVAAVGELPGHARAQYERQHEQPAGEAREDARLEAGVLRGGIGRAEYQESAQQGVVTGPECLCAEVGQETLLAQQPELARSAHARGSA